MKPLGRSNSRMCPFLWDDGKREQATMTSASILVIEDEPAIQELVAYTCSDAGIHRAPCRFRERGP